MPYIRTASSVGFQRKWEDFRFEDGTRCIELVDYIGNGMGDWNAFPGNAYGVAYTRAESFYRAFAGASFGGPCIVDIGEFPADRYSSDGEPLTDGRMAYRGYWTLAVLAAVDDYGAEELSDEEFAALRYQPDPQP